MSSKDCNMKENTNEQINFSAEEVNDIQEITNKYSEMYAEALKIQQEISKSELRLTSLIENMEELKKREYNLFINLAAKKNLEPQTIAHAAANYILIKKQ